jgi:hypothetical protein
MDGKPFFVVSQAVDPGLLQVLERDIVPRLEADIPNQPGAEQLDADLCCTASPLCLIGRATAPSSSRR